MAEEGDADPKLLMVGIVSTEPRRIHGDEANAIKDPHSCEVTFLISKCEAWNAQRFAEFCVVLEGLFVMRRQRNRKATIRLLRCSRTSKGRRHRSLDIVIPRTHNQTLHAEIERRQEAFDPVPKLRVIRGPPGECSPDIQTTEGAQVVSSPCTVTINSSKAKWRSSRSATDRSMPK